MTTKRWPIVGGLLLVLAAVNGLIAHKQHVLARGEVVLLPLAPLDPRSLMQGDYMRLRYRLGPFDDLGRDERLVLRLDANHVAEAVRIYKKGEPLAPDERLIVARYRQGQVRLGAEAYFFQEGEGPRFERARFSELRVAPDGTSVLVGLRDQARQPIAP